MSDPELMEYHDGPAGEAPQPMPEGWRPDVVQIVGKAGKHALTFTLPRHEDGSVSYDGLDAGLRALNQALWSCLEYDRMHAPVKKPPVRRKK